MILLLIALAALLGGAISSKTNPTQTAQADQRGTESYTTGMYPRQVIIKTWQGEVLSTLNVPVGVMLGIHASADRPKEMSPDGTSLVLEGNISIRTRLQTEMKAGPAGEQMLQSPLKLDVQDAIIELKTLK
jgi:hypothetical protein